MRLHRVLPGLIAFSVALSLPHAPAADAPSGDAVIRAKAGPSEVVITTTRRLAGAIHSLTWNGREFIDSVDHGRQLQSASNLDCGTPIQAETFNPTEAGSRDDSAGPTSSSRLLSLRAEGPELSTTTRMAFWLVPGEDSGGHPARNTTVLSDHLLSKKVHIGYKDLPHAIDYEVVFTVPKGEHHTEAVFEALTGYMPSAFGTFRTFDPATGTLTPLSDGPGEQPLPVVLATADGSHAMGVFAPPGQATPGGRRAGYGRFRFEAEKVNKWNCVYRVRDPGGVAPGEYRYRMFVAVGTLDDVKSTLASLAKAFPEH
jgi:hypothetical protein